jgi:hypothetical protein
LNESATSAPASGMNPLSTGNSIGMKNSNSQVTPLFESSQGANGNQPTGQAGAAAKDLPKKPDSLLKEGYSETTHPEAAQAGKRTFENPATNDKVRFDKDEPGKHGWQGKDHYHSENPKVTGKQNKYLDKNGQPCARNCEASHIEPKGK